MKDRIKQMNDVFHSFHCRQRTIVDGKFRDKGLYFGQPPILKYLSEHKNATQKEIAAALHISPPSVATSLKRMEETGLVVRLEDKDDARRNTVKLTKKGNELFDYSENMLLRINDVTYRGFTEAELDTMISFLERMNNNLKEEYNV